jgi:SdpC family antimicrobial peptide
VVNRVSTVLAVVLLLTTSVPASARMTAAQDAPRAVIYDGVTLFRGLAFADGPVAQLFEATAQAGDASPSADVVIDRLVARMGETDPDFFADFAAQIQSGDRVAIRTAVENAATLAGRAAIDEFGPGSANGDGGAGGDCIFIAGAIVAIVAGVVTVVISATALTVVNLVVTGNVAVNVDYFFSMSEGGATPLNGDVWVDDIARTLRA